jgi:hypothetical protein
MTNDVVFPTDDSEYNYNLASHAGSPTDGHRETHTPTPKPQHEPLTAKPTPQANPGTSTSNLSIIVSELAGCREIIIDMILQNNSFEDCSLTALLSLYREHPDL